MNNNKIGLEHVLITKLESEIEDNLNNEQFGVEELAGRVAEQRGGR